MSGRPRTIKPELLEDAVTAGLSDTALRVFVGVLLLADDYGNFRCEAGYLLGHIYWKRAPQLPFGEAIEELRPLVSFYHSKGQRYGSIRNWKKHQRIERPGLPKCPGPDDPESVAETEHTYIVQGGPAPMLPGMEGRGRGSERKGEDCNGEDRIGAPRDARRTSRTPGKRGSRLSPDWEPSEKTIAWCHDEGVDGEAHLDEFRDYWLAIPGAKGVKVDWDATYRNRIRKLVEWNQAKPWIAPSRATEAPNGFAPSEQPLDRLMRERGAHV